MQAQTPEVGVKKATTPAEHRLVSVEQLKKIHRDLDACQRVIWLAGCRPRGYGFDPSYVTDAQERLNEIELLLAEPAPAQGEREVAAVIGFYEGEREPRLLSWNVLPNGEHRLCTRLAQTEQQPDGEAVEIVASAIDGPCREVESIDDMAQIICGQLAEAGFLRVRKSEAANFAAPIADVLCRFGLSRDDAEALGAELAIALIPHLAQWDEDHHAAHIAQTAPEPQPQPEQSGLVNEIDEALKAWSVGPLTCLLRKVRAALDVKGASHAR